jgi:VanZ family protein
MLTRPLFWRLALAGAMLVVGALSLLPLGPDMPSTGWDKTNHLLAFAVLALLGCLAWPGRIGAALLALMVYGGLIEVLQSFTGYRSAEWADWLADGLGLLLGSGLWRMARKARLAIPQRRR